MSILDKRKIDFIGEGNDGKSVKLGISDHLDWKDEEGHLYALQEKINDYIEFVENNQIREQYPDKSIDMIVFQIYFKYTPTKLALELLGKFQELLARTPVKIEYQVLSDQE